MSFSLYPTSSDSAGLALASAPPPVVTYPLRPVVLVIDDEPGVRDSLRFILKEANSSFLTATLSKINLIPKHVWEPILARIAGTPQTAEQQQEQLPIGSGPFKLVRWAPTEEILLERNGDHFQAPKVERWIMRIVPNAEATLGMLKRGELNFLGMFGGDAASPAQSR